MGIFLLDTTVLIDAIKGKGGRDQLLDDLLAQRNLLACLIILNTFMRISRIH